MTFHQFLERRGFQADACEALEHPDFYALTESLWRALQKYGKHLPNCLGGVSGRGECTCGLFAILTH